jgi:hypothetical protein
MEVMPWFFLLFPWWILIQHIISTTFNSLKMYFNEIYLFQNSPVQPLPTPAGKFSTKIPWEKQCRISIPRPIPPKPSHAEVDCGPPNHWDLVKLSWPQNRAAFPPPSQFSQSPATWWLIVVCLNILTGQTHEFGPLDAIWLQLTSLQKSQICIEFSLPQKRAALTSPGLFSQSKGSIGSNRGEIDSRCIWAGQKIQQGHCGISLLLDSYLANIQRFLLKVRQTRFPRNSICSGNSRKIPFAPDSDWLRTCQESRHVFGAQLNGTKQLQSRNLAC